MTQIDNILIFGGIFSTANGSTYRLSQQLSDISGLPVRFQNFSRKTLSEHKGDLLSVIESAQTGLQGRVAVIGLSFGGWVACHLHHKQPGKYVSAVAVNPCLNLHKLLPQFISKPGLWIPFLMNRAMLSSCKDSMEIPPAGLTRCTAMIALDDSVLPFKPVIREATKCGAEVQIIEGGHGVKPDPAKLLTMAV